MNLRDGRDGTFARARTGREQRSRWTVYAIVISFFVLGAVWFVFVSHFFSAQEIRADGLKDLSRGEVASATYGILDNGAWKPWDKRNLFFINEERLASELQRQLLAENVAVEKVYPNVLRLLIKERQRRVVYVRDDKYLNLDTNGTITDGQIDADYIQKRLSGKSLADSSHPVIMLETSPGAATTTISTSAASTSVQLIDAETLKRWLDANGALIASGIKFKVLEVMEPEARSFNVVTDKGFRIVMDLLSPLAPQIDTYLKFMQTKSKDMNINEYVDVRAPGKVYFK